MLKIELMPDSSEIIQYERKELPLSIRSANLSTYPDMSAPCHWHEDIEWIHVLEGKMCYDVNGRRLVLEEKDSLMVNARQMHYGYSYEKQECRFSYILFHPSLFCSNPLLQEKYVTSVLKNASLEYRHFHCGQELGTMVAGFLTQIEGLKEEAAEGYELEVIALMHSLWGKLWQNKELTSGDEEPKLSDDLNLQKDMVSFLYQHYREQITLEDIAASGNVSRSKCCRMFQRYLQQSPIDFLREYRLRMSCSLLDTTEKSVTEIAFACGFNHLSYFSKCFYQHYGCTPREYRKQFCCRQGSHPENFRRP